jgi:serine phosphatase RsbU (regulator of sigma subunit)
MGWSRATVDLSPVVDYRRDEFLSREPEDKASEAMGEREDQADARDLAMGRREDKADARDLAMGRREDQADARDLAMTRREDRQDSLIARLRREAEVRDEELATLQTRLETVEGELGDLRAIRDALTPPELPQRPGLDLAASFLPAAAEEVGGDFYLVTEGPQDSTVLVVGDVVGHGIQPAKRAAFVRTTFAATAPFSDDPRQLLSWANTALVERAGVGNDFITVACVTFLPEQRSLRWAYAGHPPAVWMHDGRELAAPSQGIPLGIEVDPRYDEGTLSSVEPRGFLLYTDGLTEARHGDKRFGIEGVRMALGELQHVSPADALAVLRTRVADFAYGTLTDDLCMLAAHIR